MRKRLIQIVLVVIIMDEPGAILADNERERGVGLLSPTCLSIVF